MKRASCLLLFPLLLLSLYSCSRDPQVVARKYIENGQKYYDKGKYKEASIMYRRALQSDVRSGEAWYRLGLADLRLNNGGAAIKDFSHSTETDPKMHKAYTKDAYAQMGDLYMYSIVKVEKTRKIAIDELKSIKKALLTNNSQSFDGLRFAGFLVPYTTEPGKPVNYGEAIQFYEQANQVKPDQPKVLIPLAELSFMIKQADVGEKYCRRLIAKDKTLSQPYDLLYLYYVSSKQPGPAEQVLKEKIANNPGQGSYLLELAGFYYQANRKSDMTATLTRLTSDLKKYPNAHLLVGDFYRRAGDFDSSLQQYQQGQKDSPKEKPLYEKRIIQVLSVQNKDDEASKVVADLLKDNPKDPEAIAAHAALLLHSGKRDQIQTVINELRPLAVKPPTNTSPTLHYNLGLAYQANYQNTRNKENLEPARLQFQEAINLQPKYPAAMVGLAEIELERGDNRKAVQIIESVISTAPDSLVDSRNLKAHLIHTMGLMNMGERDKARAELNGVLKVLPASQDARYQLASLDLAERRLKEAQDEFETLRKAGDPRGLIGLIEVKVAQNDNDAAIAMVREQLKQTPDRSEYQLALANIEYRAGKMSDAATDYQKLIDKNPKVTDLYLRLGETRRYSGDLKAAEAAFKKAHEVAPSDTMPLIQLGLLYDTSGRNPEARKTYEEVLKIQPDNPIALNNLAYAIADEGADLDQALNYAQRAQQKLPQNQDVIDTLGLIYIRKNLTDDGVRLLKDLVARNPDRSAYHLHLAMGYFKQGNRTAARKELDAASRDKPSDKEQVRIKEMMAKVG